MITRFYLIGEATGLAHDMARGDLNLAQQVRGRDEPIQLIEALAGMRTSLRDALLLIRSTSAQLGGAYDDVGRITRRNLDEVAQQPDEIQQAAEMTAAVAEGACNTLSIAQAAAASQLIAQRGMQQIEHTLTIISVLSPGKGAGIERCRRAWCVSRTGSVRYWRSQALQAIDQAIVAFYQRNLVIANAAWLTLPEPRGEESITPMKKGALEGSLREVSRRLAYCLSCGLATFVLVRPIKRWEVNGLLWLLVELQNDRFAGPLPCCCFCGGDLAAHLVFLVLEIKQAACQYF